MIEDKNKPVNPVELEELKSGEPGDRLAFPKLENTRWIPSKYGEKFGYVFHSVLTSDGKYTGTKKGNQISGYGEMEFTKFNSHNFPVNFKYLGQWFLGAQHGHGLILSSENQIIFEGQWKNGRINGEGIEFNPMKQIEKHYALSLFPKKQMDLNRLFLIFDGQLWDSYQGDFRNSQWDYEKNINILRVINGDILKGSFTKKGPIPGTYFRYESNNGSIKEGYFQMRKCQKEETIYGSVLHPSVPISKRLSEIFRVGYRMLLDVEIVRESFIPTKILQTKVENHKNAYFKNALLYEGNMKDQTFHGEGIERNICPNLRTEFEKDNINIRKIFLTSSWTKFEGNFIEGFWNPEKQGTLELRDGIKLWVEKASAFRGESCKCKLIEVNESEEEKVTEGVIKRYQFYISEDKKSERKSLTFY